MKLVGSLIIIFFGIFNSSANAIKWRLIENCTTIEGGGQCLEIEDPSGFSQINFHPKSVGASRFLNIQNVSLYGTYLIQVQVQTDNGNLTALLSRHNGGIYSVVDSLTGRNIPADAGLLELAAHLHFSNVK